ncbi:MAG: DUF5011 domain-containing protein [Ginsengibacter sp.]
MKRSYSFLLLTFIVLIGFTSCEKDPIINTDKKVGISNVTYYPTFTLAGDPVMSLVAGGSFTDPGATADAGGTDVPVTATGSVDASQAGLYVLNYSATNADGFSAAASRIVVVLPEAEKPGVDLSGTYDAVSASTGTAQISKVAPGVYYTTNCWNGATVIPVYFICTDGKVITIPIQVTGFGSIKTDTPGSYSAGLISWDLNLVDLALVRTRKWQKQ